MPNMGLPPFSKLPGGDTFNLPEQAGEVVWIRNAALSGNLLHRQIAEPQQLLGLGDPLLDKILVNGHSELAGENLAQVKFVDVELFTELIQGDFLSKVFVQKSFDFLEILSFF